MQRKSRIILFMLLSCATCFGQTTFQGITPGKSTRADVERVLGRPVKQLSPTLSEYSPRQLKLKAGKTINSGKMFVQYRDSSAAAVAERIEMIVCEPVAFAKSDEACDIVAMHYEFDPSVEPFSGGTLDAQVTTDEKNGFKMVRYFGVPRYMVRTDLHRVTGGGSTVEARWAFYSRELYESVAPTGNCLGKYWGEWKTDRGRMTITRTGVGQFRATYAENNGTITGVIDGGLSGDWRDDTGGGTVYLQMLDEKTLRVNWTRTAGNGPQKGTWEGRCVETN